MLTLRDFVLVCKSALCACELTQTVSVWADHCVHACVRVQQHTCTAVLNGHLHL